MSSHKRWHTIACPRYFVKSKYMVIQGTRTRPVRDAACPGADGHPLSKGEPYERCCVADRGSHLRTARLAHPPETH